MKKPKHDYPVIIEANNRILDLITPADLRSFQRQVVRDLLRMSSRLAGLPDLPNRIARYALKSEARWIANLTYNELQTLAERYGYICPNPVCPVCGGAGWRYPFIDEDGRGPSGIQDSNENPIVCDRCSGTGGWGG